ncbi:MAG: DUF1775 domain-containing protein [Candidatus Tectomicrobia bacterium]|uniref:DUF1775 domain-containing protein n=1 Tax=Tectimicrobiota bacterium TaxID=2528274 RepID=A0A932FYH7_UNCTE|nr:DUF1775 domain-containing protein [Candidatus Tectomicrobia bacterium]
MERAFGLWGAAMMALLLATASAQAHVDAVPRDSKPKIWEVYTIRVPTETNAPTTQVTLTIPWGFELEVVQHKPPWKFSVKRDAAGLIREVSWTGGEIPPLTFDEFRFFAKNPKETGGYMWTAYQKYANGKVSTWNFQTFVKDPTAVEAGKVAPVVERGSPARAPGGARAEEGPRKGGQDELRQGMKEATTLSYVAIAVSLALILVTVIAIFQTARVR